MNAWDERMGELDPNDPVDKALLALMADASTQVAPGVRAHVVDRPDVEVMEIRAVLATHPRIPGAVGEWLSALPSDRHILVPAVASERLAGMLKRRGFKHLRVWLDHATGQVDQACWHRRAR